MSKGVCVRSIQSISNSGLLGSEDLPERGSLIAARVVDVLRRLEFMKVELEGEGRGEVFIDV